MKNFRELSKKHGLTLAAILSWESGKTTFIDSLNLNQCLTIYKGLKGYDYDWRFRDKKRRIPVCGPFRQKQTTPFTTTHISEALRNRIIILFPGVNNFNQLNEIVSLFIRVGEKPHGETGQIVSQALAKMDIVAGTYQKVRALFSCLSTIELLKPLGDYDQRLFDLATSLEDWVDYHNLASDTFSRGSYTHQLAAKRKILALARTFDTCECVFADCNDDDIRFVMLRRMQRLA